MSEMAPKLDPRSADEVARQAETLLNVYAPGWAEIDPATGRATGRSRALIGVFSRYVELILDRLNRAPDKNLLAFLDLLGATRQPPQAARVPLSFSLAVGADGAVVPARTQVATANGSGAPVIFETERELSLSPVRLTRLVSWDGTADRKTDCSLVIGSEGRAPATLFQGEQLNEHIFYVCMDEEFSYATLTYLAFNVTQAPSVPTSDLDVRTVQWETWDGRQWSAVTPQYPNATPGTPGDTTSMLAASGDVYFSALPGVPLSSVGGKVHRWLRCRLVTPLNFGATRVLDRVRLSHLPDFWPMVGRGSFSSAYVPPDISFSGLKQVDPASDFRPFGLPPSGTAPQPPALDTWYVGSRDVFSKTGVRIYLYYYLSDGNQSPVITSNPYYPALQYVNGGTTSGRVNLVWEYWDSGQWTRIGTSIAGQSTQTSDAFRFTDDGSVFSQAGGRVSSFILTAPAKPTRVNGVENLWLRIRVTGGGWFTQTSPAAHATPSLSGVKLGYTRDLTSTSQSNSGRYLDAISTYDGLNFTEQGTGEFKPFGRADDSSRSVYFGFESPAAAGAFPQRGVSLYLDFQPPAYGDTPYQAQPATAPRLNWSYWNGTETWQRDSWQRLLVRDCTEALTRPGTIEFLPPVDMRPHAFFDEQPRWWLRATWIGGDYKFLPRLKRVLTNTTTAVQALTVTNEVLGSSTGEAGQRYNATLSPLLSGIRLEVREPELPSTVERTKIAADEGADAITSLPDAGGYWVRWHEVADFYGSGPRDRHYVVEPLSGEVRFGDGVNGLIPPRGTGNLRLASYRTGGGAAGNVGVGAIRQLKTTVPYVDTASNPLAATGGVGAEDPDALRERAPRGIRHRDRAVTIEDYEDLARLATPEVARVRCVLLYDLSTDPTAATRRPGVVSLIVVPRSDALQPVPSAELAGRVRDFIVARQLPGIDLAVVAAEYVSVDVQTEIGLLRIDGARDTELAVRAALTAFLHPLTGGTDGRGWAFGRRPRRSDLYAVLEAVAGVDSVRALTLTEQPPDKTGDRFLVCSGNHRVDLTFGT